MRFPSCLPTLIFLILAGATIANGALRGSLQAQQLVPMVAVAALLHVLCAYGHEGASWALLAVLVLLPLLLVIVGVAASSAALAKSDHE